MSTSQVDTQSVFDSAGLRPGAGIAGEGDDNGEGG